MITDAQYNNFARGLAARFAQRASGLDSESARLVGIRPSDHVLTGFLTPGGAEEQESDRSAIASNADDDDPLPPALSLAAASDLPQDSAYELSNVGLEWLAPEAALSGTRELVIEAQLHVYVRRIPSFAEQCDQIAFRVPKRKRLPDGSLEPEGPALAEMRGVWTRERMPTLRVSVPCSELQRSHIVTRELRPDPAVPFCPDRTDLFPGARLLRVQKGDVADAQAYSAWRDAKIKTHAAPPSLWRPLIDVRLTRSPTHPGRVRIAVRLVNGTTAPPRASSEFVDPNLYGVKMTVVVHGDAQVPLEFRELPNSYRYNRQMPAVGINAHVECTAVGDALRFDVSTVPSHECPRLEPRTIRDAAPLYSELARDALPVLRRIHAAMVGYHSDDWVRQTAALRGEAERMEAAADRTRFADEAARFERGVRLLADPGYPAIARAFALMNEAMQTATAKPGWRLFQIVFIVSQIPALAARHYSELAADDDDLVDILWFAAGGGKTEAFLGLILWQAFFDRLRGKRLGTAALVRFPLRLLSFQQLVRISRALAAADRIRAREKLGGAHFSLGFYVGKGVTPNKISDDDHKSFVANGPDARYLRVFECPHCSSEVVLAYDSDRRLIRHVCTNGKCEGHGGLPVYIVDDDVHRYMPTVIVATVDKLALMGFQQRFANIFGRIDRYCPLHGASFAGSNRKLCLGAVVRGDSADTVMCGEHRVETETLRRADLAPSLLVQDEMHLLTEEVGAFDAHYETGAMEMARALGAKPWKIIGATATIEDYQHHAGELYLKRARQFPAPGPGAYESFYYSQNTELVGRIYVGVLGVGRKHTPSVTRALTLLYLELARARTIAETDLPRITSEYEVSGLEAVDFAALLFLYELPLVYVLTRKGSDQVSEAIETRTKRDVRAVENKELLVTNFNSSIDIADMIRTMKEIQTDTPQSDLERRVRGLIATSIIGHGVDVDRFNLMVFAGYTRLTAEYIQASARVGRRFPGISVLVCTPQSERDRSVFDRFAKFHEYVDRLVDPSAINRWAEAALDHTVPGLLAAYIMSVAASSLNVALDSAERVKEHMNSDRALTREAMLEWMERAYGVSDAPSPRYRDALRNVALNKWARLVDLQVERGAQPRWLGNFLGAMRSLRDVDEPGSIRVGDPRQAATLRRLIRG